MRELSFRVLGRELLSVRLGELESDDQPPDHTIIEAGAGGSFELSETAIGDVPEEVGFGFSPSR